MCILGYVQIELVKAMINVNKNQYKLSSSTLLVRVNKLSRFNVLSKHSNLIEWSTNWSTTKKINKKQDKSCYC